MKALNMRALGGRVPADAIYVGRARKGEYNKWGNPFVMNSERDRDLVIRNYRDWLMDQPDLVADAKEELAGKDLVCFCAPKACHADVLIEVANS